MLGKHCITELWGFVAICHPMCGNSKAGTASVTEIKKEGPPLGLFSATLGVLLGDSRTLGQRPRRACLLNS
jgi:hypothetical protein